MQATCRAGMKKTVSEREFIEFFCIADKQFIFHFGLRGVVARDKGRTQERLSGLRRRKENRYSSASTPVKEAVLCAPEQAHTGNFNCVQPISRQGSLRWTKYAAPKMQDNRATSSGQAGLYLSTSLLRYRLLSRSGIALVRLCCVLADLNIGQRIREPATQIKVI